MNKPVKKKAVKKSAAPPMPDKIPTYVPGVGPRDAKILLCAEAPGAEEEKQGTPLVGWAGQILRETLFSVGIDPSNVFMTNVCHYRPPGNDIKKFVKVSKKGVIPNALVAEGLAELYADIVDINPNVIVPLGNIALWACTGLQHITVRRGSILKSSLTASRISVASPFMQKKYGIEKSVEILSKFPGRKIIPSFHPSYVGRMPESKPIFTLDWQRIAEEHVHPKVELPQRSLYLDPPRVEAEELVKRYLQSNSLATDIECPKLHLFCVGFSPNPGECLVLKYDEPWKRDLVKLLLESDIPKIFQNGTFDTWFVLAKNGIRVRNYSYDTMFAQHAIYPEFKLGLDFQTSIYTREPYYKDEGKNQDLSIASSETQYLSYNARDCCVLHEIKTEQEKEFEEEPRFKQAFDRTMSLVPIAIEQELEGLRFNERKRDEFKTKYQEELKKLQVVLNKKVLDDLAQEVRILSSPRSKLSQKEKAERQKMIVGLAGKVMKEGFNMNSNPDVKVYLYKIRKFRAKLNKHSGSETANEDALKELYAESGDETLLTMVLIRKIRKLISSYLNVKLPVDGTTRRLYYSVRIAGPKTRRWAYGQTIEGYGFSPQTMPRYDNLPKQVRQYGDLRQLIMADKGYVFGYYDLSQVEDRFITFIAGIQDKIDAYNNGWDVHKLTASAIFNVEMDTIPSGDNPVRYLGKMSNHAYNYEMGPFTFQKHINKKADETGVRISTAEAKLFRQRHLGKYPQLEAYWSAVREALRRTRCLINLFGYKRIFYGRMDDTTFRDAYSWIPQSSAPEIINVAGLRIREDMPDVKISLHVHDAWLLQIPVLKFDDYNKRILEIMNDIQVPIRETSELLGLDYPDCPEFIKIPVDGKYGETWGDLKKAWSLDGKVN